MSRPFDLFNILLPKNKKKKGNPENAHVETNLQ